MKVIAVDPSVSSTGAALFVDGALAVCDRIRAARGASRLPPEQRWLDVSFAVWRWADHVSRGRVDEVVYERPQVYREHETPERVDRNDLPGLAAIGAGVACLARECRGARVRAYLPREWTSGTRKVKVGDPWLCSRGDRLRERLTSEELALVPAQHDVMDAVAIGLYHLGRFAPKRVYASR